MRIVLAPDSFKESMSAAAAVDAMARGVRAVVPDAVCIPAPIADGGEGFVAALAPPLGAEVIEVTVRGTLGRPHAARFALAGDLAVIEVAEAVGIGQIPPADRDLMNSASVGVGELILSALDRGARRVVVGLGGSGTNDGGAGMLAALGVRLLDEDGREIPPTPTGLRLLASVDATGLDPRLAGVEVEIASDVTNVLCGSAGASAVFGPQKGATPELVAELDALLGRFADLSGRHGAAEQPGSGAAGGLGFALMAFLGAVMRPGIDVVIDLTQLESHLVDADFVFTGEGSLDAQTAMGKGPLGVALAAKRHRVLVIGFGGRVTPDADVLLEQGFAALVPIVQGVTDLPTALRDGPANLERAVSSVTRLLVAGGAR